MTLQLSCWARWAPPSVAQHDIIMYFRTCFISPTHPFIVASSPLRCAAVRALLAVGSLFLPLLLYYFVCACLPHPPAHVTYSPGYSRGGYLLLPFYNMRALVGNLAHAVTHCRFYTSCESPLFARPPLALLYPFPVSLFGCSLLTVSRFLFLPFFGEGGSETSNNNFLPIYYFLGTTRHKNIF